MIFGKTVSTVSVQYNFEWNNMSYKIISADTPYQISDLYGNIISSYDLLNEIELQGDEEKAKELRLKINQYEKQDTNLPILEKCF